MTMVKPKTAYSRNPVEFIKDSRGQEPEIALADWGYVGPGWYFWNETWSYAYGPYEGEQEATMACAKYAEKL